MNLRCIIIHQSALRHIDIRYFFIKDNGDIKVEYLHTKSMIAD